MQEEVQQGELRVKELRGEIEGQSQKWDKEQRRVLEDVQAQIEARILEWPQQRVE